MKKILFMFTLLVGMVVNANAQKVVETSKFTDNWSITLQGGVVTPMTHFFKDGATTPTVVLGVDKYVTPWLGFGVDGRASIGTGDDWNIHTAIDHVNVNGYVKVNLANLINFNGKRHFFEPVVYTGLGWGHVCCSDAQSLSDNYALNTVHMNVNGTNMSFGIPTEYLGWIRNYLTYRAGVELNFNLGKQRAWAIVVNPAVVWGNIDNGRLWKDNGNFEVTAGVVYHFKNSNGTHTFKTYDIAAINDELNALRAHKCPEVTTKIVEKTNTVTETINKTYVVSFPFDSSELNARATSDLDEVPTNAIVTVEASASPEGTVDHNTQLSQARANAVKDYLEKRGVTVRTADGVGVYDDASNRIAVITVVE